jgi:hypothetical protein
MSRRLPAALPLAAALLVLLVPPVARAAGPSPEVKALVDRCVAAYGGEAVLKRAAVVKQFGTVTSLMHPGQAGRVARLAARGERLRVEVSYGTDGEVRVLDGATGWRDGVPVQGPPLVAMVLQSARFDLPWRLLQGKARVQDRGTVEQDGKVLRALVLELRPGQVIEADVDPATGRILRSRGAATAGPPVEFTTTYSDFRTVDGLLVAFHEVNWANGATTGETVLTSVELLPSVDPTMFRP